MIVDRFEGAIAICEAEKGNMVEIPKYKLPLETKQGDCIVERDGFYVVDKDVTEERRRAAKDQWLQIEKENNTRESE